MARLHRTRRFRLVGIRREDFHDEAPVYSYTTEEGVLKVGGCRDSLEDICVSEIDASQTCLNRSQIAISIEKNRNVVIVDRDNPMSSEKISHNCKHRGIDSMSNMLRKFATGLSKKE